jgi:hypothetical protein
MKVQLKDYPGYSIDSRGNVYSTKKGSSKLLKPQLDKTTGYLYVNLYKDKMYRKSVHRLLLTTFTSPLGEYIVNHKDGNKCNNNLSNLEWVTYSENGKHAYKFGLSTAITGEQSHNAVITENECVDIIRLILAGSDNTTIATKFNLSSGYISLIRGKRRWKHIWEQKFPNITPPKSSKTPVRNIGSYKYKLPIDVQIAIIKRIKAGETLRTLAIEFSLDPSMLSRVKSGKTWKKAYAKLNNINV